MKPTPALRSFLLGSSLLAPTITAFLALAFGTAQAATYTWDGGSSVSNDFSVDNWTGAAPTNLASHTFVFGALISPFRTTANVNLTGNPAQFVFNSEAAAMTITGSELQFATGEVNPIVNNSANLQTFTAEVRQFWSTTANRTWNASTGNLSFANVVLRGDLGATTNQTLTINGAYDTAISGTITQAGWTTGGASIIKAGAGKLTLSNNSSLDSVSVNSGTLRLTGGTLTTTKQAPTTTGLGIRLTGGALEVAGGNISVGTHGLGTHSTDTGTLNVTAGNVAITGDLLVGWNSGTTFTLSGGTTSAANIRHQDAGAGVITISGTNSTTANTVFNNTGGGGIDSLTVNLNTGGTLTTSRMYVNATGIGGSHALNINLDGGTLKASATGNLIDNPAGSNAGNASVNATVKLGGAKFDSNGATATIQRPLLHDAALGSTLDGGLTLNDTAVTKGILDLRGTSTYTGATTVTAGTLRAGAAAGGQAFGSLSAVTTANSATAILSLNGFSQTIGSLAGGGATGGNVTLGLNATLTTGGNDTSTSYAGIISGTGTSGVTKAGNGVFTLSGSNNYTGATTVNGGKLTISPTGNIDTTSGVSIGAGEFNYNSSTALSKPITFSSTGGTLSGSGTINQTVTITTGNILSIGNSVGQMNFGNALTLAGTDVVEIDGTSGPGVTGGHDFANVTGALTYGGALSLDFGTTFGIGSYSWNLFDFAGADLGTFATISLADQYSGSLLDLDANGVWDLTSGSNTWQFTESNGVLGLTVIPEPGAALLGSLGLLALLRRRR